MGQPYQIDSALGRGELECDDRMCCGDPYEVFFIVDTDTGERIYWDPFEACDTVLIDNYFDNCWSFRGDAEEALKDLLS